MASVLQLTDPCSAWISVVFRSQGNAVWLVLMSSSERYFSFEFTNHVISSEAVTKCVDFYDELKFCVD